MTQPPAGTLTPTQEVRAKALLHYALGVSLEFKQNAEGAFQEFEKSFQLDPTNGALAGRIAQFYLAKKEQEKSLAVLDQAIKANPSAPEPWLWRGITHRTNDDLTNAAAAFQQSLTLNPTYLLAIRALAEVRLQQDLVAELTNLLDQSSRQVSKESSYWMGLGDLYVFLLKQKPSLTDKIPATRIRDCYQKAHTLAPRDLDILLRTAEAQMAANDYAVAANAYEKLVTMRPDIPTLRERLAQAYLQADQKEKAAAILKEMFKREPLRYDILNTLAELYSDLDKAAEAASSLQQSIAINSNQFDVYVRLALAQLHLKRYDDALQNLSSVRAKFPIRFQIPYLIGIAHMEQKQYAKAVIAFADAEQLLRSSTEDKPTSSFYFTYGTARERNGEFDTAVTLFRKSLELDPKNHATANYLGYMWADKNQNLNEALELINRAVAAQPESSAYLDSLGWVYYRLDRNEDALKQLRQAIKLLQEPDATVYDHLADVLHKLGHHEEAITALKQGAALEPKNKEISEKLKRWTDSK